METRPFYDPQLDGKLAIDAWGEVMRHVIAHEIHHIGHYRSGLEKSAKSLFQQIL
jgi:uncharacterized damage-inducible protein DinB